MWELFNAAMTSASSCGARLLPGGLLPHKRSSISATEPLGFGNWPASTSPQAICILDFYHAGEHLSVLAEALYSADPPRVQSQAKTWRTMLLEDRLQEVLAQARQDLPDIPGPRSTAEKQIAYFERNSSRMTYASFRSQGLFIGSGVVEAGCKTVVGKRLKNSGMFWSVKGAQNILDLRTALLSNRFDHLWLARDQIAA